MHTAALVIAWLCTGVGAGMMLLYLSPGVQLMNRYTMMAASFIPYGIIAWVCAFLLFLFGARSWGKAMAVLALAGLVTQLVWAQGYFPIRRFTNPPASAEQATTLFTLNTRCYSTWRGPTAKMVMALDPDIVVMQDTGQQMREEFQADGSFDHYPHQVFFSNGPNSTCGIAIYSKVPLKDPTSDPDMGYAASVTTWVGSTKVLLLATDIPTPTKDLRGWQKELADLGEIAVNATLPVIVAGDFNAVAEHFPMRRMMNRANLHQVTSGLGPFPTWEVGRGPAPLIQIDHVLASPTITAERAQALTVAGNAHRALLVWLTAQ